jgi:hypothetical protein
VSDQNGSYNTVEDWNIDWSFEEIVINLKINKNVDNL